MGLVMMRMIVGMTIVMVGARVERQRGRRAGRNGGGEAGLGKGARLVRQEMLLVSGDAQFALKISFIYMQSVGS